MPLWDTGRNGFALSTWMPTFDSLRPSVHKKRSQWRVTSTKRVTYQVGQMRRSRRNRSCEALCMILHADVLDIFLGYLRLEWCSCRNNPTSEKMEIVLETIPCKKRLIKRIPTCMPGCCIVLHIIRELLKEMSRTFAWSDKIDTNIGIPCGVSVSGYNNVAVWSMCEIWERTLPEEHIEFLKRRTCFQRVGGTMNKRRN